MSLWKRFKKAISGKKVSASVSFPAQTPVRPLISKAWLLDNDSRRDYLVLHHTTTFDNPKTHNWDAIDRYHRSFRLNWNIQAGPVDKVTTSCKGKYFKYYDSWYDVKAVKQFYFQASTLARRQIALGTRVNEWLSGNKLETPWRAIGYNLGCERKDGELKIVYGRNLKTGGAHCYQQGMNSLGIGYCIVGNYDKFKPDSELWRFNVKAVREIIEVFPHMKILGHREVPGVIKSCPGDLWDMNRFRSDVLDGRFA